MPIALPALLAAATTLLPGLWEYKTSLVGVGGAPGQKCLTKAQIDKFLTDPSNRHYDCDYATREVGGGHVKLAGACTNRKHPEQKIGLTLKGDYTPETIEMKGHATTKLAGLDLPLAAAVTAHRLSDCTPGAPATPTPPPPAT